MKRLRFCLICAAYFLLGNCASAAPQEHFPVDLEVKEDNINIRADATVSSAVICTAFKGQRLEALAQAYDWYKVRLPKNAPAYIKKDLLESVTDRTAKVSAQRVNVRLGPSESTPVIGKVSENQVVYLLGSTGDWARIEPVYSTTGYVHKLFVREAAAAPEAAVALIEAVPAAQPVITEKKAQLTQTVPETPISIQGKILPYGRVFKRRASHKIVTSDKKTYLLKGRTENLESLTHRSAIVTGVILPDTREKYPIIDVATIEVASDTRE